MENLHPDTQWGEVNNFNGEIGKLTKIKVLLLERHHVENAAVAIHLTDDPYFVHI
ncbi:hypothetical protein OCL90_14460 [Enterococcus faecalis]|uniref:hypothetical protein n=1 Tax=Enterococcus faecalis TaxID=1351 RepID=UPI0022A808D9|nr:hypothetical protein [Enterococcus faecalis]MCZ0856359.1 hypothetical protein [Enterococcus faecalis]